MRIGMRMVMMVLALVVSLPMTAGAQATLHVNGATGDDTVARAQNSAARPWRTIGRAAWGSVDRNSPNSREAAQPGDIVVVAAGRYDFGGTIKNRFNVVYNPVNQGSSAEHPIRFRASGPVTLTAAATASPVIGCFQRNFVVWEGPFDVNEAAISISPDTGSVVMASATGCGVDGIHVDGNGSPGYVDNHTGVRIENCQSCFVKNSTITNVRHQRSNHNGSGVMLYNSDNTVIERNHIFAVNNAVFIKGVFGAGDAQSGTVVRFNLLEACDECITVSDSQDSRIYQNVIRNSRIGLNLLARGPDKFIHPVGDWFVNNTVDGMSGACVFLGGGTWHESVRVWNNILTNCTRVIYRENAGFSGEKSVDWEHNVYQGFSSAFADDAADGSYSFGEWKKVLSHDSAAPASITANPMYADAAGGDFRLCVGKGVPLAGCGGPSPALTVGMDILDLDGDGSTTDVIPAGALVGGSDPIAKPSGKRPD